MDEQKVKETLISWRHTLHAHPETAFEEVETARFVADKLGTWSMFLRIIWKN